MEWTKNKPTIKGFYWFQGRIKGRHNEIETILPIVVEVDFDFYSDIPYGIFYMPAGTSSPISFNDIINGEWAGPLKIPSSKE